MSKITLSNVADLTNSTTAQATINSNSATVQSAFDNTLSRDGTFPNTMGANLDMNSNQILNLPAPVSSSSPARLVDIISNPTLALTIPPIGTSGATVPLLNGDNTFSGNTLFNVNGGVVYPTGTFGLAIANNFSFGNAEVDFWNTSTSANLSFQWLQKTGSSSANSLMLLFPNGKLSLSSPVTGDIMTIQPGGVINTTINSGTNFAVISMSPIFTSTQSYCIISTPSISPSNFLNTAIFSAGFAHTVSVPSGAKGNFTGFESNIASAQSLADTDGLNGVIGYGSTITMTGSAIGYGIAITASYAGGPFLGMDLNLNNTSGTSGGGILINGAGSHNHCIEVQGTWTAAYVSPGFSVDGSGNVLVNSLLHPTVANASVATALSSVGPVGAHTTVQEWFPIKNASGTVRYVPGF